MLGWLSWLILARTLKVAGSKPGRGPHYFHFFLAILNKQLKELIIAWSYNGGGGGGGHVHFCPVVIETKKDLTGQTQT